MYIKKILWAIALIGLVIFGCIAFYIYGIMFNPNTVFKEDSKYIFVKSDDTYRDVREQLLPLLKDINDFDALASRKKYTTNVISGRFLITKDMTNNEIINSIRRNNKPIKLTFNNQNSIEDLAGRIAKQIEADSLTLLATMKDSLFLKENDFDASSALGMYLPNTYEFYWNTSAKSFRKKMLQYYNTFWTDAKKQKAKALKLTPSEVVVLASIVHEESKKRDEQPRVAGVYLNRLRLKMLLQADPTLKFAAYQLPEYKGKVIKRILNKHKTINSPYNTYKHLGLPPGPISMPDISAINAVLNYETHNYIYFAADPKRIGYHKFAKTLAQHNANARAYHTYLTNNGIMK